jgi:hypothetical protein
MTTYDPGCVTCGKPRTGHHPVTAACPPTDMQAARRRDMLQITLGMIGVALLLFLLRWAWAEYEIATHCTMVLGTRVCH